MKICILILLTLFLSCSTSKVATKSDVPVLTITEISPNKWTAMTRQNLEHLLGVYHLSPILFTNKMEIQSRVIPHSHPVLTLNTRYAEEPLKILSVFMHEQFHWWAVMKTKEFDKAMKDMKKLFPTLPRKGIARNVESTYLHLLICFLEYEALLFYLDRAEANRILKEFINQDKLYPWIYTQVLNRYRSIKNIASKYQLIPQGIKAPQKPTKKPPVSADSKLKNL